MLCLLGVHRGGPSLRLHCREGIITRNGIQWRRVVRRPCTRCGEWVLAEKKGFLR
jgi:hypothetical protein